MMSSLVVGAGSPAGHAQARRSSKPCVPGDGVPATTIRRSHRQRWRTARSFDATSGSTTATLARLSLRRNSYPSGGMSVLTGTATAPSFTAPQKAATNAGWSCSASSTRSSTSTPSPASAPAARATLSATLPYVIARPAYWKAGRPPRPSSTWRSTKKAAALKVGPGLEVKSAAPPGHPVRDRAGLFAYLPVEALGETRRSGRPIARQRSSDGSRPYGACGGARCPPPCNGRRYRDWRRRPPSTPRGRGAAAALRSRRRRPYRAWIARSASQRFPRAARATAEGRHAGSELGLRLGESTQEGLERLEGEIARLETEQPRPAGRASGDEAVPLETLQGPLHAGQWELEHAAEFPRIAVTQQRDREEHTGPRLGTERAR